MKTEGSAEVQKQGIFLFFHAVSHNQTHPPHSWCGRASETKEKTKSSPLEKKSLKDYMWNFVDGVLTLMSIVSYYAIQWY